MSLDPLKSRALVSSDPSRVAGSQQSRRQEVPGEELQSDAPQASSDSVELSAASRGLIGRADEADSVPQGTLSPERMHAVLRRLADGFYDGADVRAQVARRAAPDFGNSKAE